MACNVLQPPRALASLRAMWVPSGLMQRLPRRVRVFDPDEVTTVSPEEEEPAAGGLTRDGIERIWASVVDLYKTGLQPAMGVCVRRHGHVVLDRAIGHARGNAPGDSPDTPKVKATPHTLFNLFSASKVVTAMLVHLLDDRGRVHLDDAVVEYIPEFGQHGKHTITIRHILTHRAGIPTVPGTEYDLDLLVRPGEIVRLLCEARPMSVAGRQLAYHALTGGFLLAEIVRRVTGKDVRQVLAEEIEEPLGFKQFNYGVPKHLVHKVALNAFTGPRPTAPYSWLLRRALGVDMVEATTISNDPRFLTGVVPAGNVICTANGAGRFFELLLREGELDGVRVFDRRTIRRAIAETSHLELDSTLMIPVRYGMGFMLGRERFSPYGQGSPRAFGHLGFTNVLGYADPERDISVAFMNSGKPFLAPELLLWLRVMHVIARVVPRERLAS